MSGAQKRRSSRQSSPAKNEKSAVPLEAISDRELVQGCLEGDQRSWSIFIARYKRLIMSFPRKYGASSQDAADVFQVVCAELFVGLPRLRELDSLRAWICQVASRQAYQWKRRHVLRAQRENATSVEVPHGRTPVVELLDAERDELISKAMSKLRDRHRKVLHYLFFEEPPLAYDVVAKKLRIAPGSVSFLRARGLRNLEKILSQRDAG